LGFVGACVLLLTASFAWSQRANGRVLSNVHLAELDVSRLTQDEVRARLKAWSKERESAKLQLSLAGVALSFEPASAGPRIDVEDATRRALGAGREGTLGERFTSFIAAWFRPRVLPLPVTFDAAQLASLFDAWQSKVPNPPFVGGLSVNGASVTPLYPHPGTVLDRGRAEAQLKDALVHGQSNVQLATRVEAPKIERAEVDRIAALANQMLGAEVTLTSSDGSRKLSVPPAELAALLQVSADTEHGRLELGCALDATQRLLEPRRAALEQQPENAKFVIDAQDHVQIEPGRTGVLLDDHAVASALCAAAREPAKRAELPLRPGAEPALSTQAAEQLGIVGLMGSYTTRHACCQPRVQNIHHIADLLDGTLVKPGETFSVNQVVGPRSVKNGFRPAPSIEDGEMVDTVGGGVSQFATTLFNALFYGGYDILERQPHTYWFTRYPMGYDATLSYPHPDIVFKNDTDAGALIKTYYTDTTITVKIYGNNGGRKVLAEVSPRQNIVTPPIEYIPNPHLDADEEKTREGGMIGWSVIVKRKLIFPDGKIKEERRKVTYKPRARRVEVHPCKIPEGEPGHTGERCPKPDPDKVDSAAADAGAK